jgi:aryl-alcohol dehydrogenase-like predicted oxidoreductase
MERRPLGRTGLVVSALGLGCGQLGDTRLEEDAAARLVHAAVDWGITVFDTARSYGLSEERLGRHLGARRAQVLLSTKLGYGIDGFADWTGPCVAAGVDAALERLRTDCVDVVHLHSCGLETLTREDVVRALEDAVQAGKVRVMAYAGDNEALAWAVSSGRFGSVQCSVNVYDQGALGGPVSEASRRGMGVLAKRSVANAVGRGGEAPQAYRDRSGRMDLGASGFDAPEVALRFTAFAPGVDCALVGTSQVTHLEANVRAVERGPLDADVVRRLREAFQHSGDQRAET